MGNVSQTILERVYTKVETTFGTAATLAGANYMRHTKCSLIAEQGEIESTDKTGSISFSPGAAGSRGGKWSLDFEARPNGVAGTAPDCDPVLQGAFGAAGTVVAVTSVTYNMASAIKTLTIGRFRDPSTIMQQLAHGCVLQDLNFTFAQNANCRITASGSSLWVLDSKTWATTDATGKGGTAGAPAEPATPVSNGDPVNGLAGSASLDGSSDIQIRDASIRMTTAIEVPRDRLFNGQYGSNPERDKLSVFVDLVIVDEDIASVTNLYVKALARTRIPIVLTAGSVAGSRFQFTLGSVQLPMPELTDDARKWASNLRNMRCYPSTGTALDECILKIF